MVAYCLLVVYGCLLVVYGDLLVVDGRFLVFCDNLCSFVVVCDHLRSLPVLVTMKKIYHHIGIGYVYTVYMYKQFITLPKDLPFALHNRVITFLSF